MSKNFNLLIPSEGWILYIERSDKGWFGLRNSASNREELHHAPWAQEDKVEEAGVRKIGTPEVIRWDYLPDKLFLIVTLKEWQHTEPTYLEFRYFNWEKTQGNGLFRRPRTEPFPFFWRCYPRQ